MKKDKFLTEALVFKKHRVLLECEELLDEIVKEVRNVKIDPFKIDKNKRLIETKLENLFNIGALNLQFSGFGITNMGVTGMHFVNFNAFTFKKDIVSNVRQYCNINKNVVEKADGHIRWKKGALSPISTIVITMGSFNIKRITGGEILGVILHEIGHQFYAGSLISKAITTIYSVMTTVMVILNFIEETIKRLFFGMLDTSVIAKAMMTYAYSFVYNILAELGNLLIKGTPSGRTLEKMGLKGEFLSGVGETMQLIAILPFIAAKLGLSFAVSLPQIFSGDVLGEEKWADEFAAIHGYGPELVSALTKVSGLTHDEKSLEVPYYATIAAVNHWLFSLFNITDTHPGFYSRPVFLVDFYKKQLPLATPKERILIEKELEATIKNSPTYRLQTTQKGKESILRQFKTTNSDSLLAKSSILDYLKDMISSNAGSAENLTKDLEGHN